MSDGYSTPSEPLAPSAAAQGAQGGVSGSTGGGLPPMVGAAAAEAAAELPRKAADAVQLLVDTIHDKAVRPAILATRAVVFGLVVAALATVLVVVASIAVLRIFDVYVFGHRVWLSYVVLGGALTVAGLALWTLRRTRPSTARSR
jgi:hypothetical protein